MECVWSVPKETMKTMTDHIKPLRDDEREDKRPILEKKNTNQPQIKHEKMTLVLLVQFPILLSYQAISF